VTTAGERMTATLSGRERYRDNYGRQRDPIWNERLLWRAQTFRHLVHLLPGQSILELGCGDGLFTVQLQRVCRGENPITAVTFDPRRDRPAGLPANVEYHAVSSSLDQELGAQKFDFVVAIDLLDQANCAALLQQARDLLRPGGQLLLYESNPWNPVLRLRRTIARLAGRPDPRRLLNRTQLYELMSEIGFIRCFAVYNDFVYRPLTRRLAWAMRNLSIVLENTRGVRRLAGSILLHAQLPPRVVPKPSISLFEHEQLRRAVSVVLPCHNEEMNLEPMVNRLRELFGEYLREIILVDDNSADGTRAIISDLARRDPAIVPIYREPPNGVGLALTDGYRVATGEWVLSMDCDFQHLLPEVRDLLDAAAQGYDMAVGSRFSRYSVLLNYPLMKIIANRSFHLLANAVLLRRFRDLTNNLKLIRRDVLEKLLLTQSGFAINAETGLQPQLMGCKIKEVPISWINRTPDMGMSSFRLVKVGGGYWQVLWRLWLKAALGVGRYRTLERLGNSRRTQRDAGLPPTSGRAHVGSRPGDASS